MSCTIAAEPAGKNRAGFPNTDDLSLTDNMGGAESLCSNYVIRVLPNMDCQHSSQKLH